jgi:mono/diheme cytochrome c family protein
MKLVTLALSVAIATGAVLLSQAATADPEPYTVSEGTKVDQATLGGWRTWRALACERCHGAQQEGLVGPSLIESVKKLSQDEFAHTVIAGRPEKGMPGFATSDMLNKNIAGLYAYLKGRADGTIHAGRLEPLESNSSSLASDHSQ